MREQSKESQSIVSGQREIQLITDADILFWPMTNEQEETNL